MSNHDSQEIDKFNQISSDWWRLDGPCQLLHSINPPRMTFIEKHVGLVGKRVLDVGCGGGILTERLAQAGATTVGIDLAEDALMAARAHATANGLNIDYQAISAEDYAAAHPQSFDVIMCMELLEHVPDPQSIIRAIASLLKPGGTVFFATLNRTPKAFVYAILGAEYLLKLIPTGTHHYEKFIRPSELAHWLEDAGFKVRETKGLSYFPLSKRSALTTDCSVNYLVVAGMPEI